MEQQTTINSSDMEVIDYIKVILHEMLEIFALYFVYTLIVDKVKFDLYKGLKVSFIVSIITTFLEYYNPILKKNVKTGLFSSVGANIIKA